MTQTLKEALTRISMPNRLCEFLLKTHTGVPDKTLLKEARALIQQGIQENGCDWLQLQENQKLILDCGNEFIKNADATSAILNKAKLNGRISLTEAKEVCYLSYNAGYARALTEDAKTLIGTEEGQRITQRANALGLVKERIGFLSGIVEIDGNGNIKI